MIIVRLQGGLGNQLFQYAFGRRLALLRGEELFLDDEGLKNDRVTFRKYSLGVFNINAEIISSKDLYKIKYPLGLFSKISALIETKFLRHFNIGYNALLLKSKKKYFSGFFQSYKYFEPIKEILLEEITLQEPIDDKYADLLKRMRDSDSVSLHVRRGDYISDAKTKKAHYTFGLEYYQKATKIIADKISNPVYFVFSDDIAWAKENLKLNAETFFVSAPNVKDYEELILMSKCQNNIIANSSFSFWGAWLNRNSAKLVIAPKKWNNVYTLEYEKLLPRNWLKI